ncbi:MAG TPA: Stp1/IreP family PP2C-type Ser/Thr phosphatase [Ktedonobacteraceae bacterium]|nr:Stp1/IreP family PP2C-type Ser/Thr phosphatase [Ktedonobacteraceae bacterium]
MEYPPSSTGRHGTFPERLYKLLLLAYPRNFREEYGSEMLRVYRDAYRDTSYWQGVPGVLRLWADFFYDFVKTVCIEHVKSWSGESRLALSGKEQLAMTLHYTLDIAQRTDIGRKRENNEDNLISIVPDDDQLLQARGALFVVSDGMGGHDLGEVASELTIKHVKESYYQNLQDDIPTALQKAIKQANTFILQDMEAKQSAGVSSKRMGATCVAAVLHEQTLYVANIGDSRVYVLHQGQLRQVTRDHSLVSQMVERGEITAAEARTHESRNVIYRSLGQPEVEVDLFVESVMPGDSIILCTDGLCGVLEDEDLRTIVEQYGPDESVQRLIARANEEGGPDNVTAIVVRVAAA